MTKYNQTFKQQVVEFYFTHDENLSQTLHHFGLPSMTVRRWIAQFLHSGNSGLAVLHAKRTYSPEFKQQVIQAVCKGEWTTEDATLHFGLSSSSLISRWLQAFEQSGISGLQPKPKGRPPMSPKRPKYAKMPPPPKTEEDRLRLRILELEAEVAYLKKLDELIRAEEAERQQSFKH
ncbi:helix-turn-helix domain-containing protein [Neisseria lisongii]|uniref:Transposase n=1 Tax=Neisseria lisongii TaxID=2912188 RepID=A0AAW5AL64_9NEIS|nr:transposase [Neisseria lisongii]MCF7530261.1 transposase [Neisseria lisongii]